MTDNTKVWLALIRKNLEQATKSAEMPCKNPAEYGIQEDEKNIFPTLHNVLTNAYNVTCQLVRKVLPGIGSMDEVIMISKSDYCKPEEGQQSPQATDGEGG